MVKERITITVNKTLLRWIDQKIKSFDFASRSHGIESLIAKEIKKENSKDAKK